jgi:hypothetical protein
MNLFLQFSFYNFSDLSDDLYHNEGIYQTIFPPKAPRLSLLVNAQDSFFSSLNLSRSNRFSNESIIV